ncbi:response regulator [candidate division KSB1 bacterium]|nr:response regulator [candidate division KSB1 bacterium]
MTTLLIADDEQSFLDFMVRLLQKEHHLLIARNWSEVLEKFEANLWRLNATILDVNMPGLSVDPFSMVEKLLKSNPTVPMVVISGQDIVLKHDFLKMGVYQYHGKPVDMMELNLTIQGALNYNRVLRKLENFEKEENDEVKYFQKLLKLDLNEAKERISGHDTSAMKSPILIRSEVGTQPHMLAKSLSREIDGKLFFPRICSENLRNIIPYNLQNGDTLYLEGIENLARDEHTHLLKVLDELTSSETDSSYPKFRLVASVASQLDGQLHENPELRRILERLSKLEFRIDPLRLRKHELRSIISLVFEKKKKRQASPVDMISEDLYNLLVDYHWPLNFDELKMIVECLLLTCNERLLEPKHLHQLDFSDIANSKYPTLDDMVEEHIKKALRVTMGNKSKAAKMLGITPKTLYARIRN